MKKSLLVLCVLAVSMQAWAQGMFVSDHGAIVTIDEKGNVWDGTKIAFGVGFIPTYEVVTVGRNYIVATDDRIYKTDVNGLIYDNVLKGEKIRGGDIEVKGDNYFITKRGGLYTFSDYNGDYFFERDNKFKTDKVVLKGREFFLVEEKKDEYGLYVVLKTGKVKLVKRGPYIKRLIKNAGSNYFVDYQDNLMVFGVEGEVLDKSMLGKMADIKMLKGNFFLSGTDNGLKISTINKYGVVAKKGLIRDLINTKKVTAMPNYLIDKETNMMITINMETGDPMVIDLNTVLR